jgi:hypothetical protein
MTSLVFKLPLAFLFFVTILMVSCNSSGGANSSAASLSVETSLEGEKFPDGGGFKGRYNDRVFYIEVIESAVSGFVRYKNSGKENRLIGKKSSPFDFQCEELNAEDVPVAQIRGKINNKEIGADLEYSIKNSSESFRLKADK